MFSEYPVTRQLIDVYEKYGKPVVGVKPVPMEQVRKYCSLKVEPMEGEERVTFCTDMIEKPKPGEEFSNLSILGRVLLTPDIFDTIDALEPGAGGEYQLTDAMAKQARKSGVYALEFEGERFDMGSKLGFLKANLTRGLLHPETAEGLRDFIKEIAKDL
jgi:UTP--glucose-1-phosphate uridylyltransferase